MAVTERSQAQGNLKRALKSVPKPKTQTGPKPPSPESQAKKNLFTATGRKNVPKPSAQRKNWLDNMVTEGELPPPAKEAASKLSTPVNWDSFRQTAPPESTVPVKVPSAGSARGTTPRYALSTPSSAPSVGGGGVSFDRTAVARVILLAGGVNAVAVLVRNRNKQPATVTTDAGHKIKIPASMQSYAGTVVLVTIALIVNELNPGLGAVMALGIVLLAFTNTDIMAIFGNAVAPGAKTVPNIGTPGGLVQGADGSILYTGPTGSRLIPVPGHPGQYSQEPLPSKPNA